MVYRGKPSTACSLCRQRRIKCDEEKPECYKCRSTGRTCPGYLSDSNSIVIKSSNPPTNALRGVAKPNRSRILLNRTRATSALTSLQPTIFASQPASLLTPSSSSSVVKKSATPLCNVTNSEEQQAFRRVISQTLAPCLTNDVDEQAICHFVSNFVLLPPRSARPGFMDFVPPLLSEAQGKNTTFVKVFRACAFSFLSNRPDAYGNTAFFNLSLDTYHDALISLRKDLADPVKCKSDATLGASLLMIVYELINNSSSDYVGWQSHIEGAIRLIYARNMDMVCTPLGRSLFLFARTMMISRGLLSADAPVLDPAFWFPGSFTCQYHARSYHLVLQAGELRTQLNSLLKSTIPNTESIEEINSILQQCNAVDGEFVKLSKSLPESWRYRSLAWVAPLPVGQSYEDSFVFPGRVDIYRDFWSSTIQNVMRVTRLSIANMILRITAFLKTPVDYRTTPTYAIVTRRCTDIITDIIASIPYNLRWHLTCPEVVNSLDESVFACGDESSMKALGGYFSILSLSWVYVHDCSTEAQRSWASGRLAYIANELGLRQATIASRIRYRTPSMQIYVDIETTRVIRQRLKMASESPGSMGISSQEPLPFPKTSLHSLTVNSTLKSIIPKTKVRRETPPYTVLSPPPSDSSPASSSASSPLIPRLPITQKVSDSSFI